MATINPDQTLEVDCVTDDRLPLPSSCYGKSVLMVQNSARQSVRTIGLLRVLHDEHCTIRIIGWQRGLADRANQKEIFGSKLDTVPAKNIFIFLCKALYLGLHSSSQIFLTVDIRFVPLIVFLSKLNKGIAIYDSKELPSVTVTERVNEKSWTKLFFIKHIILAGYSLYENFCFRLVDGILCLDSRDDFLFKAANMLNGNVEIILNVVDIIPSIVNESAKKYCKTYSDTPTIVFSGGLYHDKGLDHYLKAVAELKRSIPNLKLVICGIIKIPKNQFDDLLRTYGITNHVDVYERMPFNEHLGLLKCCKVGLALMRLDRPKFKKIGPGTAQKIFTYMAAGLPIIISRGHFAAIVEQEQCGLVVDFDSTSQLVKAIEYLLTNEEARIRLGRKGLNAVKERYNIEIEKKKMLQVINKALMRRMFKASPIKNGI